MAFALADSTVVGTLTLNHYTEAVSGGTIHLVTSINAVGGAAEVPVSLSFASSGVSSQASQGTLTTVGAGTLTAALILDTDILRSGPTGAFIDTTDTAAAIQTAWTGGSIGSSFVLTYQNTTAFQATLAGGIGVTLSGALIVPPNMWSRFLVVWTGAGAVTFYNLSMGLMAPLPNEQFTTSSVTVGTMAAGLITGANQVVWLQTGATPGLQTTRTAAQMLADIPNGRVGMQWRVRIINTGAGSLTPTADGSVTLTNSAAVAQNTWREYQMTILTATTASMQGIGSGVMP